MDTASRLKEELQTARKRLDETGKVFQETLDHADSLPPYPDGIVHLRQVSREYREAFYEFMKVVVRRAEFVTGTVVPDELKKLSSSD